MVRVRITCQHNHGTVLVTHYFANQKIADKEVAEWLRKGYMSDGTLHSPHSIIHVEVKEIEHGSTS